MQKKRVDAYLKRWDLSRVSAVITLEVLLVAYL